MSVMSFVFFGLMLVPMLGFLYWIIKKDRKKSYLGLFLLMLGILATIIIIIRYDEKFLNPETAPTGNLAPKSSNFK